MGDTRDDDTGPSEQETWWPSDFGLPSNSASNILWTTGSLSEPIPNGFYSVIPDSRLKQLFNSIPTLEDLHALGDEGLKADVILVDFQKDKKLFRQKQLITKLVSGFNSKPAAIIKKIAGLVETVYKQSTVHSPAKTTQSLENCGIQLLGQIKNGSCRPRAILFKVLADTVGLQSRLVVGLSSDGAAESVDSYNHISVTVLLNSVEMLVDLMRFPGQLIPLSTKVIYMSHISAAGESDSAENDSCDSPLEPNSPMFGYPELENAEKDESLLFRRKLEGYPNRSGPPSRNMLLRSASVIERKLSYSQSESNIANEIWRQNRRKVNADQRTVGSSPEHLSFRTRTRFMLSGDRNLAQDFTGDVATSSSKSVGRAKLETKRIRRRSISITPEIGDDIVRAVRAMNEALKQNRLSKEQCDDGSSPNSPNDRIEGPHLQKNVSGFHLDAHDQVSGGRSILSREPLDPQSQKAISLPSSPKNYRGQSYERNGSSHRNISHIWDKVLGSPMFQNKPLLPYEEWYIDFSELTVGIRVGIGFFGEVFRGVWNGTDVAIKAFLEQDLTAENMEDFCNEISILSRLRHPNVSINSDLQLLVVILFLGACTKPPRLSLITEYMEMGSLYNLLRLSGQKKKLSWRRKLKMLRDICRGLMCIHRMGIVHRDIKSANCLLSSKLTVKICDFGLSRIMTGTTMRDAVSAGTPEWMAPELIRNEPFSEKCDIFSLGVIMWELCTLTRPWEGVPPERVVYAVAYEGARLEIPEGPLGKLIADCWTEPEQRPRCSDILSRLMDCEYALC
ncbi:hypothetical protein HID58_071465 [Brassica napus]|uniref:Protein kinase domain-containing protein n=1 Tax=Brassica napus TaxID=3708 RepID=A0ABQ7Z1R9_BRANA|nr:hypothetical protein HID58_071465 [Brassica napus]